VPASLDPRKKTWVTNPTTQNNEKEKSHNYALEYEVDVRVRIEVLRTAVEPLAEIDNNCHIRIGSSAQLVPPP
jgi:hypothetical protein